MLMVMAEIGIINDTAVVLHIQSTIPATFRCRFNDGQNFPCEIGLRLIMKESRPFCR